MLGQEPVESCHGLESPCEVGPRHQRGLHNLHVVLGGEPVEDRPRSCHRIREHNPESAEGGSDANGRLSEWVDTPAHGLGQRSGRMAVRAAPKSSNLLANSIRSSIGTLAPVGLRKAAALNLGIVPNT